MRSIWEGVVNEPKTRKSKAPVPVIVPMRKLLDQYRRGNPVSGPIFATMKEKPTPLCLNNVFRQILPVLNACVCGKPEDEHKKEDHEYQRGRVLRGTVGTLSGADSQTNLHAWT